MQVLVRQWKGKHFIVSVYTTSGRLVFEVGSYRMRSGGLYIQAIADDGYVGYVGDVAMMLVNYSGRESWESRGEIVRKIEEIIGG